MTLKVVSSPSPLEELLDILARLRHPITGSPWEREQSCASIAPNTLEEAYEVVDAITRDDMHELKGELGDLLLQVVFHSQIAREGGHFTFNDVAQGIVDKIKARLPHFFAGRDVSVERQLEDWDKIKQTERDAKGHASVLDGIAHSLPALVKAQKIQARVARVGFKWPDTAGVLAKIDEELNEVKTALQTGDKQSLREEIGDLLSAVTILADRMGLDAEEALRYANIKFDHRFRHVEAKLHANGKNWPEATLEQLLLYWNEAKQGEQQQRRVS